MAKVRDLLCLFVMVGVVTMLLSSCYRMPNDDEYSLVPATNNPDVVGDKGGQSWMPGAGF